MSTRRLVTLLLIATVAAGCAAHRPPPPMDGPPVGTDDKAGAIAADVFYVPLRGVVCGATAILSGVVMLITLGHGYDSASELMHGACSGPWVVSASEIRRAAP